MSDTSVFLTTVILIGGGVATLLFSTALLGYALAGLEPRAPTVRGLRRTVAALVLVLGTWFGWAVATSLSGPLDFAIVLPGALAAIALGGAITYLPTVATLLAAIPTSWLVGAQFYRVLGALFIVPYLTSGVLTPGFALLAGIGDVITGILAVPVAMAVARRGRHAKTALWAWSAFGILDLVVAPTAAAVFGFEAAGQTPGFPITTIPLFFGPPFGILIHIVTLRAFALRHSTTDDDDAPAVAGPALAVR